MLIYWILYIILEALLQSYLIEKKNWKPIYIQLFLFRGIASILFGGLILDAQNTDEALLMWIFQACSFWVIFDPLLNILRKKPFFYKGKESGWLDKIPYPIWYILKVVALALAVLFFRQSLNIWPL